MRTNNRNIAVGNSINIIGSTGTSILFGTGIGYGSGLTDTTSNIIIYTIIGSTPSGYIL